mmetsp:Transcript_68194/g.154277  ORF Transcript_68194/g.154277 Transcript_68194/m.154277 type:complete len:268 (-) Transcript_68194:453-1256(-)
MVVLVIFFQNRHFRSGIGLRSLAKGKRQKPQAPLEALLGQFLAPAGIAFPEPAEVELSDKAREKAGFVTFEDHFQLQGLLLRRRGRRQVAASAPTSGPKRRLCFSKVRAREDHLEQEAGARRRRETSAGVDHEPLWLSLARGPIRGLARGLAPLRGRVLQGASSLDLGRHHVETTRAQVSPHARRAQAAGGHGRRKLALARHVLALGLALATAERRPRLRPGPGAHLEPGLELGAPFGVRRPGGAKPRPELTLRQREAPGAHGRRRA